MFISHGRAKMRLVPHVNIHHKTFPVLMTDIHAVLSAVAEGSTNTLVHHITGHRGKASYVWSFVMFFLTLADGIC
jgi:hypothetical protein